MGQLYNFPKAMRGDSYNDVEFTVLLNSVPQNLTNVKIRMWVTDSINNKIPVLDFTTDNGKMVITDAVNGKFKTNFGIIKATPKDYNYDIEFDFNNGTVKTWISGKFCVTDDVTK